MYCGQSSVGRTTEQDVIVNAGIGPNQSIKKNISIKLKLEILLKGLLNPTKTETKAHAINVTVV